MILPVNRGKGQSAPLFSLSVPVLRIALCAWALVSIACLAWAVFKYGIAVDSILVFATWAAAVGVAVKWRSRAAIVLACALAIRVAMLVVTGGENMDRADPLGYENLAHGLLRGDGLVWHIPGFYDMRAGYPPLYVLLLAGAYAVAGSLAPFALNTLIDVAAAFAVYRFLKRQADETVARVTAIAFLFWPSAILGATVPNKEGLLVLLVVLFASAWIEVRPWLLGVSAALICLTQPAIAPFLALAGVLWLLKRHWRESAIALAMAALVMLPWWIRNYLVLGGFVPLTTSSGLNLYAAATGSYAAPAAINALPEIERSSALLRAGIDYIFSNPLRWVVASSKQAAIALGVDQAGVEMLELLQRPAKVRPYAFALVLQLPYTAAVIGAAWASWKGRVNRMHALMMCALIQLAIIQIWFEFGPRHRVHLVAVAVLATALALGAARKGASASNS